VMYTSPGVLAVQFAQYVVTNLLVFICIKVES
jgi:hypothetical protein